MPKNMLSAKLPVEIFKEGGLFIAYCPALDISTSAESLAEVRKMFAEMVNIFFEEVIKMGTMDEVLSQCGWRKVSRPQRHWEPPKRQFITELQQEISIPCPA